VSVVGDDRTGTMPELYIFIVGVSRSGTSLMRRVLNKSSEIALCDETHYMGHLIRSEGMRQKFRRFGNLRDDGNVGRLVAWMFSPAFHRYSWWKELGWQWRFLVEKYERDEVERRLLACDRSEPAVFDVFMQLFADLQGARIKGEKTPIHVRYVPELLSWYPGARFIHMLRDPRAIYVSEVRRRRDRPNTPPFKVLVHVPFLFKLALALQTAVMWRESVRLYERYRERFGDRYVLMRFEDLVGDPRRTVPRLCADLGVDFQEQMLDQDVISFGFKHGEKGFDASAARRWEQHIDGWARGLLERWLGPTMRRFGYER
jgi:hypothetical protein